MNHVCVSYPRGGSVAARLQESRPPTTLASAPERAPASPERPSESDESAGDFFLLSRFLCSFDDLRRVYVPLSSVQCLLVIHLGVPISGFPCPSKHTYSPRPSHTHPPVFAPLTEMGTPKSKKDKKKLKPMSREEIKNRAELLGASS